MKEGKLLLNDIAGYHKEKEELIKIINVLNNRNEFYEKGAYIPKGLILYGNPGNGKTLFAKVLANETAFNFIEFNISEKNPPKKLSNLIKLARKKSPAILFIDEINRIVSDCNYQSDMTRRTLATLLSLLDGFKTKEGQEIFVVATANNYDQIPDALVRPGRMDKKLFIDSPSSLDRKEILSYYIEKTNCYFDIEMEKMVSLTSSLSSSGIKTLINSCVIDSDGEDIVSEEVFIKNVNEIVFENIEKESSSHDLEIIAYQEVGKFIVARNYSEGKYLLNTNFNGSSKGEIYFSESLDVDDDDYYYDDETDEENESEDFEEIQNPNENEIFSMDDYIKRIQIDLGGLIANKKYNKSQYSSDTKAVNSIVATVKHLMKNGYYGFDYAFDLDNSYSHLSETRKQILEDKLIEIIKNQYIKVEEIIIKHKEVFSILVPLLIKRKILGFEEVEMKIKKYFS